MNRLDRIAKEWIAARDTIADFLFESGMDRERAEILAEAIIARLAAHNPPILLSMEATDDDD